MVRSIDMPDMHDIARKIMTNLRSISVDLDSVVAAPSSNPAIIRAYMTAQKSLKYFNGIRQAGATTAQIEPIMVNVYGMANVATETVKYEVMRDTLLPAFISYIISIEGKVLNNALGAEMIEYIPLTAEDQAALLIEINKVQAGF
ncbi:hypothetical protein OAP25_02220 [Flavobacteriaceae bacterium]|nr:hypothetical protein [Flavobacteriaceae bacterium]